MAEVYPIQSYRPKPPVTDGVLALQTTAAPVIPLRGRGTVIPFPEQRIRKEPQTLVEYMEDFSVHFQHHGLPQDWYKFNGIGFSMKTQMGLLENEHDSTAVEKWTQQTSRDILGFCLEYLSRGLVFAYQYDTHTRADGKKELVDPLYGNKRMIDMVDEHERGGAVREALAQAEQFFLDPSTPDGSMFVMPSPSGPSGLTTDKGEAITYPDSFWFVITKHGNSFPGITIKTDFTHEEYRQAIKILTGQEIPESASLYEYVKATAHITPGEHPLGISSQKQLIDVLRDVRLHAQGRIDAYKGRRWDEVYLDAEKGEELYAFNKEVQHAIEDFKAYMGGGSHSRLDIQKALAATLLRLSKFFLQEQKHQQMGVSVGGLRRGTDAAFAYAQQQAMSFGDVFTEVKKIEGCAGGGAAANGEVATSVLSLVHRLATVPGKKQEQSKDKKEKMCGVCGRSAADNHYHCPKESGGCGRQYADETQAMSRTKQCGCGFKFNC